MRLAAPLALRLIALAAALHLGAAGGGAQAPRGADKLPPAAVAESLTALRELDLQVRRSPNDAAAWYRRGMIAWALAERDRYEPGIPGLDRTTLGRMADTSLRIAAAIEQSNAFYRLMAGRYLLNSGTTISRAAAYPMLESALEAARRSDNPYAHSETAIEVGRIYWRRYDGFANRWNTTGAGEACAPVTGMIGPSEADRMIRGMRDCATPMPDAGELDYLRAEEHFREAMDVEPRNQRAHRQFAMLLVEKRRWAELETLARARITAAPWDAWAYLTLGLALHERRAGTAEVVAAYDSAFVLLPPDESLWLHRFERILNPADTVKVQSESPMARFALHRLFWITATPLWSREAATPQLDYLSRVVFAELRWTVDEMGIRGAETDRGDVYIRYGAPDVVMSRRASDDASAPIVTTWVYRSGLVFTFAGQATFATARIAPGDEQAFGDMIRSAPALWNVESDLTIDSLPAQFARFRARADSVELLLAFRPPVTSILERSELRGSVRADYWLLAGGTITTARDSTQVAADTIYTFQHRVAPQTYTYRAEASLAGSPRAARSATAFIAGDDPATGFRLRGFGISDVLIATKASERAQTPIRWSDLAFVPLVGPTLREVPLTLIWENYDLTNDGGTARYGVRIIVTPDGGRGGRVAARVIGRVAAAVGVQTGPDQVTLAFDRTTAFRSTLLDQVVISLGDTPPGDYLVTVEVTDVPTGHKTQRTTTLRLR
jgi:GWxTD domain-containing protein